MVVVILVAVIIAAAFTYELLVVPQLSVATVNGERVSVGQFRDRVTFEQAWVLQQAQARYSQAEQQASKMKKDYVCTEHLFWALANLESHRAAGKILNNAGINPDNIFQALNTIQNN